MSIKLSAAKSLVFLFIISLLASRSPFALSQETPPPATASQPADIKLEQVEEKIKEVENATDLDENTKTTVIELLKKSVEQLKLAEQHAQKKAALAKRRNAAPVLLEKIKADLETPEKRAKLDIPDDATVAYLEQQYTSAKENLENVEKQYKQLTELSNQQSNRLVDIPKQQQALKQQITTIEKAIAAPPQPNDPPLLTSAQQTYQMAHLKALQSEIELTEEELLTYDATKELSKFEIQQAERDVEQATKQYEQWEHEVTKRREIKAREQLKEAQELVNNVSEVLKPVAEENLRLARLRTGPPESASNGMISKIEQVQLELDRTKQQLKTVQSISSELEEKKELISNASFLGPWLMEQLVKLPKVDDLKLQISKRQQEMNSTRFQISNLKRSDNELRNLSEEKDAISAKFDQRLNVELRQKILQVADEIYEVQQLLINDVLADYSTYLGRLTDVSVAQQTLITDTEELNKKIKGFLMWTRTSETLQPKDTAAAADALMWLTDPGKWSVFITDVRYVFGNNIVPISVFAVILIFLLITRHSANRRLRVLGEEAASSYLTPFRNTVAAILLTLVISAFRPLLLFMLGYLMQSSTSAAAFTRSAGYALTASSAVLLLLEVMRKMLLKEGLAHSHFRWHLGHIRAIRRALRLITLFGLPLYFCILLIGHDGDIERINSLGRILLITLLLILTYFLSRIWRPVKSTAQQAAERKASLQMKVLHYTSLFVPLLITLLLILGYQFTAWQLFMRLLYTLSFLLLLSLLYGATLRWLRLVRGIMTLEQIQAKREADLEAAEDELRDVQDYRAAQESQIDLESINQQTRKLLHGSIVTLLVIGLWMIWQDAIPGADRLHHVLWRASELQVVTVNNVLMAALIAIVTLMAARNIPGMVEVMLPTNLNLDAGSRYAFSTLVRYFVLAMGIAFVSSLVGIGWSKVQWLVAALSVGVGFGLQELVANFISGLILLFERPIRVGDVITVDGVSGVVTRVQMRATTIRNWDRQEYIVPNKDLVTGRLLNWTLSSQMNRITVKVGVAYGSDVHKVRKVLLDIVSAHEKILSDPEPLVTFEEFADSSLIFIVRACIDKLNDRLEMTHELHAVIHDRFVEENIEIAFPQRDLHIRSVQQTVPIQEMHSSNGSSTGDTELQPESNNNN